MYKIGLIGGHFTTAKSVIEELISPKFSYKTKDIVFFGKKLEAKKKSVEFEEISDMGIKFINIFAFKINRFVTLKNIFFLVLFPITIVVAIASLIKYRPRVIIGFGGYLELPVLLAAKLLGSYVIIHEGTVRGGAANRFLAHVADEILISFSSSWPFFKKAKLVGCPLRKSIISAEKNSGSLPIVLIAGGHLGSKKINSTALEIIDKLLESHIVIHQTGVYDYEKVLKKKTSLPAEVRYRYIVKKFFDGDQYAKNLANASLLISRCGINTVCEAIYLKIPSVFIPLPFAQQNEQFENAMLAKEIGLSEILEQKDLNPDSLLSLGDKVENFDLSKVDNRIYRNIFQNASRKIAEKIYEKAN